MSKIYRIVANYQRPYSILNTSPNEAVLRCRKLDLYRSIITVGNPSFLSLTSIREFGLFRTLYISLLEKVLLVASNIQSDRGGMRRHPIFNTYISDKKRIVSYNLGMAFAKYYSEKLLEMPHLIHIEFLKRNGVVTFTHQPGNARPKEPDLVGQTSDGNWHIIEAKGLSGHESQLPAKIAEAKLQIQQIAAINGTPPASGTACATCIGEDRIFSRLEDPPSRNGARLKIDKQQFYMAYYAPFLCTKSRTRADRRKTRIDGLDVEFHVLHYGSRRLRIGLACEVAELVISRRFSDLPRTRQILREYALSDRPPDRYSIGLDGFVVGY